MVEHRPPKPGVEGSSPSSPANRVKCKCIVTVNLDVELITPIAMEKELRFAIREGGHTVGAGVVTDIVE